MKKDVTPRMRQRIKALYTYTNALENGDFETLAAILQQAEHDAVLEQMIVAMNEVYEHEDNVQEESGQAMEHLTEPSLSTHRSEQGTTLPSRRIRRFNAFFGTLAAVLIVGLLVGSFLALFASRRASLGGGGPLSHVNGTWRVINSPRASSNDHLNGIVALSTNDVWAVGTTSGSSVDQAKTLIEHWDGTKWSIVASPNPGVTSNGLTGIASVSANDIWAVGFTSNRSDNNVDKSLLLHWNGTKWSVVGNPTVMQGSQLLQLAAISTNNVWAVGYSMSGTSSRPLIEHWNGTAWSVVPDAFASRSGQNLLTGISARSADDIWAVGWTGNNHPSGALIEHWNGQRWNIISNQATEGMQPTLSSVAALSANNAWAVGSSSGTSIGSDGQTLIEHWDGTRWSVVYSPNQGSYDSLGALTIVSANDIWAVGFSNHSPQTLIEHWNGEQWSVVTSPQLNSSVLSDVAAISTDDVWAVGFINTEGSISRGLIEHYSK